MQTAIMGALAGLAIALLALLAQAFPAQQLWVVFGGLAGVILTSRQCCDDGDGGDS